MSSQTKSTEASTDKKDEQVYDSNAVQFLIGGYIRENAQKMNIPSDISIVIADFYGHYFENSGLLQTMKQKFELFTLLISNESSIKNMNKTKLLYKLSQDGEDGEVFINKLRGNAPYLFIVKTGFGNICGGYTTFDCNKAPIQQEIDQDAFVYIFDSKRYYFEKDVKPTIFPAVRRQPKFPMDYNIDYYGGNYGEIYLFTFGPGGLGPLAIGYEEKMDPTEDAEGILARSDFTKYYDMKGYRNCILSGDNFVKEDGPPWVEWFYGIKEIEVFHLPM